MGSVTPHHSKSRRRPFHELDLIRRKILSYPSKKRGNVDFARKPSHTQASSIPVCIPVSLLHAGKSPIAVWHGIVESAAD